MYQISSYIGPWFKIMFHICFCHFSPFHLLLQECFPLLLCLSRFVLYLSLNLSVALFLGAVFLLSTSHIMIFSNLISCSLSYFHLYLKFLSMKCFLFCCSLLFDFVMPFPLSSSFASVLSCKMQYKLMMMMMTFRKAILHPSPPNCSVWFTLEAIL